MTPTESKSSDHSPMATQENNHHRELVEHVQERLGQHREVLEALTDLDNELSADAERALEILDELED